MQPEVVKMVAEQGGRYRFLKKLSWFDDELRFKTQNVLTVLTFIALRSLLKLAKLQSCAKASASFYVLNLELH